MNFIYGLIKRHDLGYKSRINRSKRILDPILSQIDINKSVLEIGAGSCDITHYLTKNKFEVIPVDIQDISFFTKIKPILYDGKKLPFSDKRFGTSLLITVLHHVDKPEKLLMEASRVSERVIIVEDVYENFIQKCLTYFMDSVINFEFFNHPRSNKTDTEWKKTFDKLNLKLIYSRRDPFWVVFKSATYVLDNM